MKRERVDDDTEAVVSPPPPLPSLRDTTIRSSANTGKGSLYSSSNKAAGSNFFSRQYQPQLADPYVARSDQFPTHIHAIEYNVLSAEEAHRLSVLQVRRVPGDQVVNGVNDPKLGGGDHFSACKVCGRRSTECVGHNGHIDLEAPVFHVGFFPAVVRICRTICKRCSHVLLTEPEMEYYSRRLQSQMEPLQRTALVNSIQVEAYKTKVCLNCKDKNGTVRRVRPMRIVHEKYELPSEKSGAEERTDLRELSHKLDKAEQHEPGLKGRLSYIKEFLDPIRVRSLFAAIPRKHYILLGMQPNCRPADLLISSIVIPPLVVRPQAKTGSSTRDDDLTIQYNDLLTASESLKDGTNEAHKYVENWENMQSRYIRLLDSSMPGFAHTWQSGDFKSYAQRLKGKLGRFRGNLSGKRVDFSGRSVISPDPNLQVDELAVPLHVAKVLTYPQRVYKHNLEQMRKLVRNGPNVHPGAVKVYLAKEKSYKLLQSSRDRELLATKLSIGDLVERHLVNDDLILFNRQPSLHRISMMAHRARVLPYRSFRFNVCCCAPYNADFDGDEMNVHLVQTEEARAEAKELMLTAKNIINAKNGEPIIACIQDFLTAMYLVTSMDVFLDRAQFTAAVSHWLGRESANKFVLPIPAVIKPVELWTGKQLVELIIRPTPDSEILLNLEAKARSYSGKDMYYDKNEGFVAFLDSHLISGRMDKKLLGGGAKDGLFARLHALAGGLYTARVMSFVAQFTSRYLQNYGFSLGLGDVAPTPSLDLKKAEVLQSSFARCDALIEEASKGQLVPLPGLSVKQTLEAKLNSELSAVRDECGQAAASTLDPVVNAPLIMVNSGSKGSALNTAQMMACVGQQTVNGKRIGNAFVHRSLPHFHQYAEDPSARGFVANSFYSGLTPTEFFFHTMAGREGLVDTAVKTAETGYIYRRLSKAMENLQVLYDHSVRHPDGSVVQLCYGEDGLDPLLMEGNDGTPLNLNQEWLAVKAAVARRLQRRRRQRLELSAVDEGKKATKKKEGGATLVLSEEEFYKQYLISLTPDETLQLVEGCLESRPEALERVAAYVRSEEEEESYYHATQHQHRSEEEEAESYASISKADAQASGSSGSRLNLSDLRQLAKIGSYRFKGEIQKFFGAKVQNQRELREQMQLPATEIAIAKGAKGGSGAKSKKGGATEEGGQEALQLLEECQTKVVPLSLAMVAHFLLHCARKYRLKTCDPGTPCGTIAAQSIGEPSTQMTLRTFHFAGVASMNITQGVPRLVEVINANKNIHTPVVTAPILLARHISDVREGESMDAATVARQHLLLNDAKLPGFSKMPLEQQQRQTGRAIRGLLERVLLKEVMLEMVEVMCKGEYYLQIYLNLSVIRQLLLPIDAVVVRDKIAAAAARPMSVLKALHHHVEQAVEVVSVDSLRVYPGRVVSPASPGAATFLAQLLLTQLPGVEVGGVTGINRVMLNRDATEVIAEGTKLREVMALPHVDGTKAVCNHVMEVEKVLGIEAARATIVQEIGSILTAYSLTIDIRHIYLLADVMTSKGNVLGITRYGIHKMKNNVLTMASFERTTEHLYNAAVSQRVDTHLSVSESIIIGKPIPLGTSSFRVLLAPGTLSAPVHIPVVAEEKEDKVVHRAATASKSHKAAKSSSRSLEEYDVHRDFTEQIISHYKRALYDPKYYYLSGKYTSAANTSSSRLPPLAVQQAFHLDLFV